MMNLEQRALLISLILFVSLYSVKAADTCSAYKYIDVDLNLGAYGVMGMNLHEFHGVQSSEMPYDAFSPTQSYDSTHICGVLIHNEVSAGIDAKAIVWSANGGMLKKGGSSIENDLSGYYQVCGDEDCSAGSDHYAACKSDRCAYSYVFGEAGQAGAYGSAGAVGVFEKAYGEVSSYGSPVDFAAASATDPSKKMYSPQYDILCGEDGLWHACDRTSCQCVSNYACGEQEVGKWFWCQYGCDPLTGKCKSGEQQKECQPAPVGKGESMGPFDNSCGIQITAKDLSQGDRQAITADVSYNGGQKTDWVIECDNQENVVSTEDTSDGEKTCYVTCGGIFPDSTGVLKPTLEVCYSLPAPQPIQPPTPVQIPTPTPTPTPNPNPAPAEEIKPTPPTPVCKPYYEVMSVKDETTDTPEVKEPDACKYTQNISIDQTDCKKTGGDLDDANYEKIDIPVCEASINSVKDVGKDVLGSPYDPEKERKRELGVTCDGAITNVDWSIEGQDINLTVDAMSKANDSGYYGDNCQYMVCLYNTSGERVKCGELLTQWWKRAEGEVFRTNFNSMGPQQFLSLDTYLGWDISNLGGSFEIRLYSKDTNVPETLVDSQVFSLCQENFLTLCTTTETQKKYWLFGDEVNKTVYWGVNSAEFMNLATAKGDTNSTTWLLNSILYRTMDAKDCTMKDASGAPSQIKYYTIANDPVYRDFVNATYGNETFYRKFLNMSEDSDYMYCYKTDLWNTSSCSEINYNWYSFSGDNSLDQITRAYREDLKTWNSHQAVDEISPLDIGRSTVTPSYDPHPCSIALDKDYYKAMDTMLVTYTNAPADCTMYLYPEVEGTGSAVAKWTIEGSGFQNYTLNETDPLGEYTAVINCGECYVHDNAYVNVSMLDNVMSRVFTVSPYLEDIRNKLTWTETGNDTLYGGAGFERYDRCSLSCDAKNQFRLLAGCTNDKGADLLGCSNCTGKGNCTNDSQGTCPGSKGDCWDQVCRISTRNYELEADPGKEGDSFHSVPYTGECPAGFPEKPIAVGYYTRPADDGVWSSSSSASEQGQHVTKCVLDGGVIASTTFDFPQPQQATEDTGTSPECSSNTAGSQGESPLYVVASNATIYMNQTAPNVWMLYQNETLNETLNIAKPGNEIKKRNERILIYALERYGSGFDISDNLKSIGFPTDYKERTKQGEVTADFLKPYTQVWLINGQDYIGSPLDQNEEKAIEDYRDNGGDLLISVDHSSEEKGVTGQLQCAAMISSTFQKMLTPLAAHYGVKFSGCIGTANSCLTQGTYIYNDGYKGYYFKMDKCHPFFTGISSLSSTYSDAFMDIDTSNQYAKYLKVLSVMDSKDSTTPFTATGTITADQKAYGTILLNEGDDASGQSKGRIVFDNSFSRFFQTTSGSGSSPDKCSDADKKYQQNIAKWLAKQLEPPTEGVNMPLNVTPSLLIVDTGNMPFNITYVNISRNGSRYNITRIFVPNESSSDYGKEFIVTSKIIFNYTVMDSAKTFYVDLNNSYYTEVRRDKDYVACNYSSCGTGGGMNYTLAASGTDKTASCGGISTKVAGDTTTYRRETETELLDKEYGETDTLKTDALSHQSVLCSTLDELKVEGTVDEYYDAQGNLIMYSASENPIKITISPDILGGFTFAINNSAIVYSSLYYPARHQLTIKDSAPYSDWEWSSLDDKYGYQDQRFGYPQQCKKTCPALECSCPAGDPLKTSCMDFNQQALVERTDCACVPQDCYPNPCVSNRTYHESEGSVVANGDFETGDLSMWTKSAASDTAEVNLSGHSGYMLKLKGGVEQTIPNLSTDPYNEICIEYALNEYKKDGSINLSVTLDGKDNSFKVWNDSENCSDCLGWNKKCFPVSGKISKVKVESSVEAYIDNVNLGKYYDYASIYTYSTPRFEYMDQPDRGWDSFGLLKTTGIAHVGNTYSFEFESMPRVYMESRNFSVTQEKAADIISELDSQAGNAAAGSASSLTALKALFQDNGITLSDYARIEKGSGKWSVIDGDRNYDVYADDIGGLNVIDMGFASVSLAEDDFKNGLMQVKTFFKDILIPMSPNVVEDKSAADPICYTMNITFRRPSALSVAVSPSGYTIAAGTRVTVTYKLALYDGTPLPNEKVYVDLSGTNVWTLSPQGVYKDYMFSYEELSSSTDQQDKLKADLVNLGYADIAQKLDKAQYAADGANKITITTSGGSATLEVADGACHLKLDNGQDIVVGITEDYEGKLLVYESNEQKNLAYAITDQNGIAQCSFIPTGTSVGGLFGGGSTASPTQASVGIHTVSIKSPLFSGEFLLLALILVFGVFSYKYFGSRKLDLYSWWRDFRGRK